MPSNVGIEQLRIFQSLFKGREDVFAVRWEKGDKAGYMPAYNVNWDAYKEHKNKGGTFKDFTDKTLQPLSDEQFLKHFQGQHFIGIYPLLADNTSWFIAADFDEQNWQQDSVKFIEVCKEYGLHSYMERSRSGNGAHVWLFFEKPYPAFKSRQIAMAMLNYAGIKVQPDHNSSFDRLFPNQDYHSGQALGNLIALPLNKDVLDKGNGCFIDTQSMLPIEQQWEFLKIIKRISIQNLDAVYFQISKGNEKQQELSNTGELTIVLDNRLRLSRSHLPLALLNLLKENISFLNSEFIAKKKAGLNTWQTPIRFNVLEETAQEVIAPRGMTGKVLRFCREKDIKISFRDERKLLKQVTFSSSIQLKAFQVPAMEASRKKDIGIISAPPGSGKTVIALSIIAEKQQPTLIIVHRKQLMEQWIERITTFLKISRPEIGIIGQSEIRIGSKITVAMIQSLTALSQKEELSKYKEVFGMIIVDECHHIPAQTYRDSVEQLSSYYSYGLTATPFRRHNDEKLLFAYLGEVIAEINPTTSTSKREPALIIRNTDLTIPFDIKTDKIDTLLKILIHDSMRNNKVIADIQQEVAAGRKAVVITERKEHLAVFNQLLKQSFDVVTLSGDDKEIERKQKWQLLNTGDFDVLVTTGQLFGEGSDLSLIDCLFIAFPFAFEGKLIQYIGRVQRGEFAPIIYDYHDSQIDYLHKLFIERNKYYNRLRKKCRLKENIQLVLSFDKDNVEIEGCNNRISIKELNLPASILEFKSGTRWLIRVIDHKEEQKQLLCEILDYNYQQPEEGDALRFLDVSAIHFRSLETSKLLKSVIAKGTIINSADEAVTDNSSKKETIEEVIKVPIITLEFGYGIARFSYFSQRLYEQLFFEIENDHIRPEFEVLKPYFLKALKSRKIRVVIRLDIYKGKVISKTATSFDLEGLNETIIADLKFQFVTKEITGGKGDSKKILNLNECLNSEKYKHPLYQSEQNLLEDILRWKNVRHYYQLKYLAKRHETNLLKIRFVLMPFSFVFLISGEKQNHVVLETLDTEEATYIWHLNKDFENMSTSLKNIDEAIIQLRSDGRQAYLDSKPINFSRIIHDYSNPRKGFILWKEDIEAKMQ